MTNPARSASNGRDARGGAPPRLRGLASRRSRRGSPECMPASVAAREYGVRAAATDQLGPLPYRRRARRARRARARSSGRGSRARSPSDPRRSRREQFGMKYGDTRSRPRSRRMSPCSMIALMPPIAEPKTMPTRSGRRRCRDRHPRPPPSTPRARTGRCHPSGALLRRRRDPAGSKSFTSAATRTGIALASKERMKSMPLSPGDGGVAMSPGASCPTGVTAPRPVTTTRFDMVSAA